MEMRETLYFVSESLGIENLVLSHSLNIEKKKWANGIGEQRKS